MPKSKEWIVAPAAPKSFIESVTEHPLLAQVLYNRGLRTPAEVRAFLRGEDAVADDPYRLADMEVAVARIMDAVAREELICVYGDFDADGVTSTVLLVEALREIGGNVKYRIPDRVDEGYGVHREAVDLIAGQAQLMVTVDCGIRSVFEVAHARQRGLDVIVTDHHTIGNQLPDATAVINPHRTDNPGSSGPLAGVGVAYRLAQAVLGAAVDQKRLSQAAVEEIQVRLGDLVALGTVADVVPLLGENRTLVTRGLRQINAQPRIGVLELMKQSDLQKGAVDATAIAFRLAPRINAAGRLASARLAYDLLHTTDATKAGNLAQELDKLNRERQTKTNRAMKIGEAQLALRLAENPPILAVSSADFEHGILGLVAGKLAERFYRPALVMRAEDGVLRGSARSIPEFDISGALDEVGALLLRHGGHPLAAGFTLETTRQDDFVAAMEAVGHRVLAGQGELRPKLRIDAEVELQDVNWVLVDQFARLEPTGEGNRPPVLMARNCRVRGTRTVGDGSHLKLVLDSAVPGKAFDAIGFRLGEWSNVLKEGSRIDVAFQVESNMWQNERRLQLNVQDLRVV